MHLAKHVVKCINLDVNSNPVIIRIELADCQFSHIMLYEKKYAVVFPENNTLILQCSALKFQLKMQRSVQL